MQRPNCDVTGCHGESEGVDVGDVLDTVLPGHETLDVDVELVPHGQDGLVILLIPGEIHTHCSHQVHTHTQDRKSTRLNSSH